MATAGKVIKCRAAVAWEPNKPLVIEEIEVAPPQENEIRVKVIATGLCHTDLYHLFEGKQNVGFPIVLGHEGAGVVESVGPGVTEFKPGDKVIPLCASQCRQCRFCKSSKTNLCDESWSSKPFTSMSGLFTRLTCRGQPVLQFTGTSTFSEYTVMNQMSLTKIHDDAQLDRVCLFACGISTGYGAAINTAKRSALESCVKGWGVSVIVGYTECDFSARPSQLIFGRTWKGSLLGGFKLKDAVPKLVLDHMAGRIKLDEFVTHTMNLEKINDAIDLLKSGKCIRTIINLSK